MFFDNIIFNFDDNNQNSNNLFNISDGLMYGNMFKDEYIPYKDYRPKKIITENERDLLLYKIYCYDFAINDLSLYLDLHPQNNKLFNIFKNYTNELKKNIKIYEEKYGPLELDCSDYSEYKWYLDPWPFEGGK